MTPVGEERGGCDRCAVDDCLPPGEASGAGDVCACRPWESCPNNPARNVEYLRRRNRRNLFPIYDVSPAVAAGYDPRGGCSCWVRERPAEERFGIRYGAHNPACDEFSPSYDPVDAVADAELRMLHEVGITSIGATVISKQSHPDVWAILEGTADEWPLSDV